MLYDCWTFLTPFINYDKTLGTVTGAKCLGLSPPERNQVSNDFIRLQALRFLSIKLYMSENKNIKIR